MQDYIMDEPLNVSCDEPYYKCDEKVKLQEKRINKFLLHLNFL